MTLAVMSISSSLLAQAPQRTAGASVTNAPGATAQSPVFIVKTIPLRHLSSAEAMKLLSPYSTTPGGGVYDVAGVRAVTIRETAAVWQQITPVLERYDREPESVSVGFVIIRADTSGRTDPSLAGLDLTLRNVLRFTGYQAVSRPAVQVLEGAMAVQSFVVDKQPLRVMCSVERVNNDTNPATAELHISLSRSDTSGARRAVPPELNILSTSLTIPEGHTVVVGSGSDGATSLILAVQWKKGPIGKKD
jgi:hypothetical protein